MEESQKYHQLAKDAGNRLRAYILSVSSGATGVFFIALTKTGKTRLASSEQWLLTIALISFVITVALCLLELRVDAMRFFDLGMELEKPKSKQDWKANERYKSKRFVLLHLSYATLGIAIISTSAYLVLKIVGV
jgi:hypothetical protein